MSALPIHAAEETAATSLLSAQPLITATLTFVFKEMDAQLNQSTVTMETPVPSILPSVKQTELASANTSRQFVPPLLLVLPRHAILLQDSASLSEMQLAMTTMLALPILASMEMETTLAPLLPSHAMDLPLVTQ